MSEAESRQDDGADDRSSDALDLFSDLVFVYAMSQVTQLMLTDLTWLESPAAPSRWLPSGGRGPVSRGLPPRRGASSSSGR